MRASSLALWLPRGLLSTARWRTRAVIWLAAALSAMACVTFARLSDLALLGFNETIRGRPWLSMLWTPVIGMAVVWATRRHFPAARGSGIPQTIAAIRLLRSARPAGHLLSLPIAGAKVLLGALGLLAGFSAGREGPSVQLAASIMVSAHRLLPNRRAIRDHDLALAGGAAGIAAAFNTPLAGITFAVEELGRRLEARTSGVLLSTIIVAGLTAIAFAGNYRYFGALAAGGFGAGVLPAIVCAGLVCGLAGALFSRLLLWPQRSVNTRLWAWRARNPVVFAGLCGVLVAAIGWASDGVSFGSGYAITSQAIAGQVQLPWYTPAARFVATVITYFSGIPGGIFAPSLAVGAAIGLDFARWFDFGMAAHPLVAICMTGFLAAVTQSPITSAIIVMEMIDGHSMVISLMAAALLSKVVSERLAPELYQRLSLDFLSKSAGTDQGRPAA